MLALHGSTSLARGQHALFEPILQWVPRYTATRLVNLYFTNDRRICVARDPLHEHTILINGITVLSFVASNYDDPSLLCCRTRCMEIGGNKTLSRLFAVFMFIDRIFVQNTTQQCSQVCFHTLPRPLVTILLWRLRYAGFVKKADRVRTTGHNTSTVNWGRIPLGYPAASRRPTTNRSPMERVWAARGSPAGGRKASGSKPKVRSGCV